MGITDRVYEIMNKQKKKQTDLANYLGVGKTTVNGWFHQTGDIPGKYLQGICEFLNASPRYILTGEEETEDTQKAPAATAEVPVMSEDESELLRIFHALDREGRTMVLATAYSQRARMLSNDSGKPGATA